jgi:hypothetical protein
MNKERIYQLIEKKGGVDMEYHLIPPGTRQLAETIAAFANTLGGHIFIGVKHGQGKTSIEGFSSNFKPFKQAELALEGIDQTVKATFDFVDNEKKVFAIEVQKSHEAVTIDGQYYIRKGTKNMKTELEQYYSVFISYSTKDATFAKKLYSDLKSNGVHVWMDWASLLPGDDLIDGIHKGVEECEKNLLVCSEYSLKSWWVDDEINGFFEKEQNFMKATGIKRNMVIPIDIDGYWISDAWLSGKRSQIKSRLVADFVGWEANPEKYSTSFSTLLKALTKS